MSHSHTHTHTVCVQIDIYDCLYSMSVPCRLWVSGTGQLSQNLLSARQSLAQTMAVNHPWPFTPAILVSWSPTVTTLLYSITGWEEPYLLVIHTLLPSYIGFSTTAQFKAWRSLHASFWQGLQQVFGSADSVILHPGHWSGHHWQHRGLCRHLGGCHTHTRR